MTHHNILCNCWKNNLQQRHHDIMQCIIGSTCLNNTGNCRTGSIPHLKALLKLHYPNEEKHLLCGKCLGQQSYPMNSKWIIIHIPRIVTILSYTQKPQENKTPKTLSLASASCSLLRQVPYGNLGTSNPKSGPGFGSNKNIGRFQQKSSRSRTL